MPGNRMTMNCLPGNSMTMNCLPGFRMSYLPYSSRRLCRSYSFVLFLILGAFSLGYLLMDDLTRAIAQFYTGGAGGMPGAGGGGSGGSGWTGVLLDSMSSPSESSSGDASVNQQPWIPPVPELPPVLDEAVRQAELAGRLRLNWWGSLYNETILDSFVQSQMEIERNIEVALVADGYSPQVIFEKRHEIRGFLFYPNGRALSQNTYGDYLAQITHLGTRASVPYNRVVRAIKYCSLLLD